MSNYAEKLKDPRWQKKRLEIMKIDGFKCRECGDSKSTLHVHHAYYVSGREPWEYPNGTLATLCENCHSEKRSAPACWLWGDGDDSLHWAKWEEAASVFLFVLRDVDFDLHGFVSSIKPATGMSCLEFLPLLQKAVREGRITREMLEPDSVPVLAP